MHTHSFRAMGQLFMMGWEGEEVTPQIRSLIADYGLGSVILTAKNLKCRPELPYVNFHHIQASFSALTLPSRRGHGQACSGAADHSSGCRPPSSFAYCG